MGDVRSDSSIEQDRLLLHYTDLLPQPPKVVAAEVLPPQCDVPRFGVVEALDELDNGNNEC